MRDGDEFAQQGAETIDRRELLTLLGASLGLAGVGCSFKAAEHLSLSPAVLHATAVSVSGVGTALHVTTRDGRPVKVDGHPDHPLVRGGSGPLEQAELWRLYDPRRARAVLRDGKPVSRADFYDAINPLVTTAAKKDGGRTVRFLSEPTSSPLLVELRARILERLPNARFVSWAPLSAQNRYDGAKLAFGRPFEPLYSFARARVVAAFDHDFLDARGPGLGIARDWADRRAPGPDMARLYVIEPSPTVTGGAADHRLAVKGTDVETLMRALIAAVAQTRPALMPLAANAPKLDAAKTKWVTALARDLIAAGAQALVTVGDRQPPVVHAMAHALSSELGALGSTVTLVVPAVSDAGNQGPAALANLANELAAGQVDVLVITACNPVAHGFGNIDLHGLLEQRRTERAVIYLGTYEDETAAVSQWFLPRQHPLEAWGDTRALDGSVLFQQPLVEPLSTDALSEAQLFALLAEDRSRPADLLRESWKRRLPEAPFDKWLAGGIAPQSAFEAESVALDLNAIAAVPVGRVTPGLELQLTGDCKVLDGRFAGCAWTQELPDPVTKLVWDNAALMSPATAKKLGVDTGARVKLSMAASGLAASRVAPVLVLPGHADDAVTLALGYGQDGVGVDAYSLRHSDAPWFAAVEATVAEGRHELVIVREPLEGRAPALHVSSSELHGLELPRSESPASGWGMAFDLSRCTGCSACVLACQAENNIPVVGKKGVARDRAMVWIRVDRYVTADGDAVTQPVTCQHCEQAPCEPACPTGATPHTSGGVNLVVYNQCVGSRACVSHCPYKVRRFNYFDWGKALTVKNPAVVVRQRGVVEKCTFCSQRLEAGETKTACQQACPTGAIAFGALSDAESEVAKWHRDPRRYTLSPELGTRPRTVYLVRVKNPNPELRVKRVREEKSPQQTTTRSLSPRGERAGVRGRAHTALAAATSPQQTTTHSLSPRGERAGVRGRAHAALTAATSSQHACRLPSRISTLSTLPRSLPSPCPSPREGRGDAFMRAEPQP